MPDSNPLGIQMVCETCGSHSDFCAASGSDKGDCPEFSGPVAMIPLAEIPEETIEALRAEHLKVNTVDSTAEEMGEPPPGVKGADEQLEELAQEALNNPIDDRTGEGQSPGSALG